MASTRSSMDDIMSPGSSAEPIASTPAIDFDSIDDPPALKALLKAREEKMRTLEKRIEIAQGAKNKLKERYTEKVDMLEQLVIALRRKLQTKVDEETSASLDAGSADQKHADRIAELEKQNTGLKEMVAIQRQQVAAAKAEARGVSSPRQGNAGVLSKMEERLSELTAALQARTRECKAQAQLLEQKETKILELQTAIVNVQNKSPDASGLSHKVQMLNSELDEARSMGTELKRQRDRFAAEFEALQSLVDKQRVEKEELMRDHSERAMQLTALQKERDRQIKETEEMQRMLCELEDQRNQLATEADELKNEVSESMSRSMNASLAAEREGKQVEVLRHEADTLRRHLASSAKVGKENEMLQLELRIAVDRNAKLEADLKSEQQQLAEMQAALESMSTKLQHVRQQNALQTQELQQATADKLQEAVGRANKMQQELTEQTLQCEQTAAQLKYAQEQLNETAKRLAVTHVDFDKLRTEHATVVERCETLQREVVWRDQETDRRAGELQQARMSLDGLTSTNKQLDMDLAACRALIEKMDAQRRVEESTRAKLQDELDAAVSSNTQLQQAKEQVARDLANAKDGNSNLQDRVSVLTSQLMARGQEVQQVQQQAATQERDLLEALAASERLKRDIAVRDASLQEVSGEAARLGESQEQMKREMAKMRGEKDHLLTQALSDAEVREGLEARIKSLSEEIAGLKALCERLSTELQSKDESLSKLADSRANLNSKISELENSLGEKEMEVVDRDRQLTVAHNRILGLEARLRDTDTKNREAGLPMGPFHASPCVRRWRVCPV